MALTKIDICNQALLKVGADMIASLDTSSTSTDAHIRSASLCNVFFDQALEESIRVYPFNSCKKRFYNKSGSLFASLPTSHETRS